MDMKNINKKSLREEADRIKSEFEKLSVDGKVNSEALIIIKSLFMLVNLLIAIFLEKTNPKNNKNSSKPPSQTEKDESALTKKGTHGKGKEESDFKARNTRTVENILLSKVSQCDVCGQDLRKAPCIGHERRTKIDIIFEKTIEHVDSEIKQCRTCDNTVKGKFPSDMPGPLQYGNGLKAYIINLLICQMVALCRIQKMVKSIIGETLSPATILNFVLRLHTALEVWESLTIERLLKASTMHVDETSIRTDKKNYWIHVYSSGDLTLKFLHRKRGTEAIEHINLIPRYSGIITHDCWSSYLTYNHCGHSLCGSHLLRELTGVIESNEYQWAMDMKILLQEACKKVSKRKRKKLASGEYETLQKKYQDILALGEAELPEIPEKANGKRGKIAKTEAHNLWERLKKYESYVLLFAKESDVSFTNNRAEQDLRMSKVKQKVSGCFRTEIYAKAYCRISSYLQTMANKGFNPLIAIQMALSGEFI
jgi:transposase